MSNILVRDLDSRIVNRLKTIAKRHGRSLQGEAKAILTEAASFLATEAASVSKRWQGSFIGRRLSDSSKLIREDRQMERWKRSRLLDEVKRLDPRAERSLAEENFSGEKWPEY